LFQTVQVDDCLLREGPTDAARAELAQGLMMLLFEDMLRALPAHSLAYIRESVRAGSKITIDHSALRTVRAASGGFPLGQAGFHRILVPLGYLRGEAYPLPSRLTGHRYTHADFPEAIPQMFLSELQMEQFSRASQEAMARVTASSTDPLPAWCGPVLEELELAGSVSFDVAVRLLPNLAACFACQHEEPSIADYELLDGESPELSWFATEGTILNHFASRVANVQSVYDQQRQLGRAMKDSIEISPSERLAQTSFRSNLAERLFVGAAGTLVSRRVPGSFWEIISRATDASGNLYLKFDVGNAQSILETMTAT
jgi:hypothetical protein